MLPLQQFASLLTIFLFFSSIHAAPADDASIQTRDDGDDDVHADWTWLSFEGCDKNQKKAIKQAHEDAVTMAENVKKIDFSNDRGAADYFGPPHLNKKFQGSIQDIFEHVSTFRLSDFWPGYKMHARCGDKNDQQYQNRCRKPGVIAYQWNTKTDAENPNNAPRYDKADALSNMHFCDQFFHFSPLDSVVDELKNHDLFTWRYDVSKYKNQAYIMLHEMMHATVMTYKQNKDRRIVDMSMEVYVYERRKDSRDWKRRLVKMDVYKPEPCKILARTERAYVAENGITINADNYAQFALAKYIQTKLPDKEYPWLPLANQQAENWNPRSSALLITANDGSWGVNADEFQSMTGGKVDVEANDIGDDQEATLPLDGDSDNALVPLSEYPSSYQDSMRQWSSILDIPDPECASSGHKGLLADAPKKVSTFSHEEAKAKIKEFCNDKGLWDTVFTPPISRGTGQTKDGKGKALGGYGNYSINGGKDTLWVSATFGTDSCTGYITWPPKRAGLRDTDICIHRFSEILNGCDTDTTDSKKGGSLKDVCTIYDLMAVPKDEPGPSDTRTDDDLGDVKCEDTDTSILGSDYDNTCTCWYEGRPEQTEIFNVPEDDGCDSIDYVPAWTRTEDPDYHPAYITPEVTVTAAP